jgi:hypothetical protein
MPDENSALNQIKVLEVSQIRQQSSYLSFLTGVFTAKVR